MTFDIFSNERILRQTFILPKGAHRHDSLFLIESGSFTLKTARGEWHIRQGEVAFFKANELFERHIVSPASINYTQLCESIPEIPFTSRLDFQDQMRLHATWKLLKDTYADGTNTALRNHFIQDILCQYLIEQQSRRTPDRVVTDAIAYIHQHLSDKLTVEKLATLTHLSRPSFHARFTREMHQSPIQYIIDRRITRAKELLLCTEDSVSEIALCCGYENVYYFSNAFKKQTGAGPTEYRKTHSL